MSNNTSDVNELNKYRVDAIFNDSKELIKMNPKLTYRVFYGKFNNKDVSNINNLNTRLIQRDIHPHIFEIKRSDLIDIKQMSGEDYCNLINVDSNKCMFKYDKLIIVLTVTRNFAEKYYKGVEKV